MGRILLWRDGLTFFRANPFFGIGMNQYSEQAELVAHNSYVHSYAELGFFGGTLFLLTWLIPIFCCRKSEMSPTAGQLAWRLRPCVLAIVVAYAVGLFSLSRDYVAPTYLSIGIGCAFCALTCSRGENSWAVVNRRLVFKAVLAGVLMIGFLYTFVRVMTA
jgi:O-antigen ligase